MAVNIGSSLIGSARLGNQNIFKMYLGTVEVYADLSLLGELYAFSGARKFTQISPNDFTLISGYSTTVPTGTYYGGGYLNRFYVLSNTTDIVYELDLETGITVNTVTLTACLGYGIGGTATNLYLNNDGSTLGVGIFELDPDTLVVLGLFTSQVNTLPRAIGGTQDRLFTGGITGTDTIYEHDTLTGTVINSAPVDVAQGFVAESIRSIGGTNDRLFASFQSTGGLIAEFDLDTLVVTNLGSSADSGEAVYVGISGVKTII